MTSSVNKHLVKAIAELAIFLGFTPDTLLDEDASIEALEQLSASLQMMTDEDQGSFKEHLHNLAKTYDDAQKRKFVLELPETLGF